MNTLIVNGPRGTVENAFGILKQTWLELLGKSKLNVVYLLDIITACAILHNILRKQTHENLEALGVMLDNGISEDDDYNAYLDAHVYDICDDGIPQRRTRIDRERIFDVL